MARDSTIAEEAGAEPSAPMLRSDSQDNLPDAHSNLNHRRKRFVRLSRLTSPTGQLCLAFLIYVLTAGLYWNVFTAIFYFGSTLNDALMSTSWRVRATEYAFPSIVGFFSGILINKIGPRYPLLAGCIGYPLKIAAYLSYNTSFIECYYTTAHCQDHYTQSTGFIAFAGIVLSLCQGLSGSVVPYLMLAHSASSHKGRAIGWFLGTWSLCALIGASTSLSWTRDSEHLGYYAWVYGTFRPKSILFAPFLILALLGVCLCLLIVDVGRARGRGMSSKVPLVAETWSNLTLRLWRDIFVNPYMLSLLPMFFVSTWFYGYQFAKANSNIQFTQRAQALNLVLYWSMSIVGSVTLGAALDLVRIRKKARARLVWLVLLVLTITIWSGGSAFQAWNDSYVNKFLQSFEHERPLDPGRNSYWGPAMLFLFYGLHSATWQVASIIGALREDDRRLANYAGAYNAAQSAGNAVIWRLISPGTYVVGFDYPSTRSVFDAVWALAIASLLIAAPTFFSGVREDTCPDRTESEACNTSEEEAEAVARPAEDVATEIGAAAVALPRSQALQTNRTSKPTVSGSVTCIVYMLASVIVLLPIGLATLGTLVNAGGSGGCLPDNTFVISGNFDIWDPQYILTLTVGFGRMSFAIAKFVDLSWDVSVGYGGQALLIWIAYKILTRYLVCVMEHDGVTMRTYTAVAFHTGSLKGAWMLTRELARRKDYTILRNLAMIVYIGIYLLIFPAIISAMTSYAPIGDAYVRFDLDTGNGNTSVNRPFAEFELVNQTAGIWTYHNLTNITTATLLQGASCTQTNFYRWGFSYLMLFILAVASSVVTVLLILLKNHSGLDSSVHDFYTPGLWRSVMDMSSHARSIIDGNDPEHLRTEELEQKLDDTRMAFDRDDLAAAQSNVATGDGTSNTVDRVPGQTDSSEKAGLIQRAEAIWRRRKRSKGSDVHESRLAQYEGV